MPTKKWTEEEEEFLKDNYMELSNADLAEKFDITKNAVQKKLARMGLKRSEPTDEPSSDEVSEVDVVEEKLPDTVSAESHFFLGNKLYHEDHDYNQAIDEYKQAAEEESDELIRLKACYWMAESYMKLGNIEEAMDIFGELAEEHESHYLGDSAKRRLGVLTEYLVTRDQ